MKSIIRYPIYPIYLLSVELPLDGIPLTVTLETNQYYLHVLSDSDCEGYKTRILMVVLDEELMMNEPGNFLGRCNRVGDWRAWNFFDQGWKE